MLKKCCHKLQKVINFSDGCAGQYKTWQNFPMSPQRFNKVVFYLFIFLNRDHAMVWVVLLNTQLTKQIFKDHIETRLLHLKTFMILLSLLIYKAKFQYFINTDHENEKKIIYSRNSLAKLLQEFIKCRFIPISTNKLEIKSFRLELKLYSQQHCSKSTTL